MEREAQQSTPREWLSILRRQTADAGAQPRRRLPRARRRLAPDPERRAPARAGEPSIEQGLLVEVLSRARMLRQPERSPIERVPVLRGSPPHTRHFVGRLLSGSRTGVAPNEEWPPHAERCDGEDAAARLMEVPEGPRPRMADAGWRPRDDRNGVPVLHQEARLGDDLARRLRPGGRRAVAPDQERQAHATQRGRAHRSKGLVALRVRARLGGPHWGHGQSRHSEDPEVESWVSVLRGSARLADEFARRPLSQARPRMAPDQERQAHAARRGRRHKPKGMVALSVRARLGGTRRRKDVGPPLLQGVPPCAKPRRSHHAQAPQAGALGRLRGRAPLAEAKGEVRRSGLAAVHVHLPLGRRVR